MLDDWARVVDGLSEPAQHGNEYDLLLIGRRHLRSNNSWMHNLPRLTGGSNRCTLLMHPLDAERRGVRAGSTVTIESAVGRINAPVEISDEVMIGVVCLPHGWGHGTRDGVGWRHASSAGGSSINDITDTGAFDPLSGNAAVSGTPVRVQSS